MQTESDQRLLEAPQEVLEHAAHHVDVGHAAWCLPAMQQPPLPLSHQRLRARHPVQPSLRVRAAQPAGSTASPHTTTSPTSARPRVSTSVTHCTTSAGTSGAVRGAKSASTPWRGGATRREGSAWPAQHPALVPGDAATRSPRGAGAVGEAGRCTARGSAPGTWDAAAAGTGGI